MSDSLPAQAPAAPLLSEPTPKRLRGTALWLIRHAEVEVRYQRIFGGRIDMDLSPRGHRQAQALAAYLRHTQWDALYASPMRRVRQTLDPLLANGAPRPELVPDFREVDFGDWTGLSWEEVEARYGVSAFRWLDELERDGIPNAESGARFQARLEPPLRALLQRHQGGVAAIACHGGVIRAILSILFGWPLPQLAAVEIDYASVTRVILEEQKACAELLNFTPWRDLPSQ